LTLKGVLVSCALVVAVSVAVGRGGCVVMVRGGDSRVGNNSDGDGWMSGGL
jgi:hypothetical protein